MNLDRAILRALFLVAVAVTPSLAGPATRPAIPELVAGPRWTTPFVARGVAGERGEECFGFVVATDGTRQVTSVFDPDDGTPYFISDGRETLIYDLLNNRIVRLAGSYGNFGLLWDPMKPSPFNVACNITAGRPGANTHTAWFQIDQWAKLVDGIKVVSTTTEWTTYGDLRTAGQVSLVEIKPNDASVVRFFSFRDGTPMMRMEASYVGGAVPAEFLTYPDAAKLPDDLHVTRVPPDQAEACMTKMASYLFVPKIALNATPTIRAAIDKQSEAAGVPAFDWDVMRLRDRTFGRAYRAALKAEGVDLAVPDLEPATRPAVTTRHATVP